MDDYLSRIASSEVRSSSSSKVRLESESTLIDSTSSLYDALTASIAELLESPHDDSKLQQLLFCSAAVEVNVESIIHHQSLVDEADRLKRQCVELDASTSRFTAKCMEYESELQNLLYPRPSSGDAVVDEFNKTEYSTTTTVKPTTSSYNLHQLLVLAEKMTRHSHSAHDVIQVSRKSKSDVPISAPIVHPPAPLEQQMACSLLHLDEAQLIQRATQMPNDNINNNDDNG